VASLPPADRPIVQLRGPDFRGGKARVADLVRTLGMEPWIAIGAAAYGEAKRDLLLGAGGFVYPSRWEGCGNSVLEAVALGLPTLCTTYPLGRYLADREGALLAEPTAEALATSLLLMNDHERMEAMGRTGAAIVRSDFTWAGVASSWLRQVASCLAQASADRTP